MQPIQSLGAASALTPLARAAHVANAPASSGPSFKEVLANSVEQLSAARDQPAATQAKLATIAQSESTLSTAIQVGDRMLAAFDQIKDMRI